MAFGRKTKDSASSASSPTDPEAQALKDTKSAGKLMFDQARQRLLTGTIRTTYEKKDHYRVRICCCQASSYWITVVTGVICALVLVIIALWNLNELLSFTQFAPWTVGACVIQALLMAVFLKQPMLLLPFRIACGVFRTLCLVGIIYPTSAILGYTFITFIQDLGAASDPNHKSGASNTEFRDGLLLILACVGMYAALGVITTAATKCAAQLRDGEKKAAAPTDA